jgi:hypothetical protein
MKAVRKLRSDRNFLDRVPPCKRRRAANSDVRQPKPVHKLHNLPKMRAPHLLAPRRHHHPWLNDRDLTSLDRVAQYKRRRQDRSRSGSTARNSHNLHPRPDPSPVADHSSKRHRKPDLNLSRGRRHNLRRHLRHNLQHVRRSLRARFLKHALRNRQPRALGLQAVKTTSATK